MRSVPGQQIKRERRERTEAVRENLTCFIVFNTDISAYITLIEAFVTERIPSVEFESQYLKLFKEEKRIPPPQVYMVLNNLFTDVDAFCPDPALRNQFSIDEIELRERARRAYGELRRPESTKAGP
jgi:hypothetical protein